MESKKSTTPKHMVSTNTLSMTLAQSERTSIIQTSDLPKKARDLSLFLLNRQLNLRDQLIMVMQILHDCRFISKEKLQEMKLNQTKTKPGALSKLEDPILYVLTLFVQDVYEIYIRPQQTAPVKCLLFVELGVNRLECCQMLQLLITTVFAKLMQIEQSALMSTDSIEENLQIVTHILSIIYLDETLKPLKDGQEIVMYFTMQTVNTTTDINVYLTVIAMCVTFLPAVNEENTIAILLAKTIEQLFKTINRYDMCQEIRPDKYLIGYLFKELLLESHTGTYFDSSSLIYLILQVAIEFNKRLLKIKSKVGQALGQAVELMDIEIISFLDEIFAEQIKVQSCKPEETPQMHKIVLDLPWLEHKTDTNKLGSDQENWLRVNFALIDLAVWCMSRYYRKQENLKLIGTVKSSLSHMCDLIRAQVFYILKQGLFQPYLPHFSKQLSVIPMHIGYDCPLVQTLHKLFNAWTFQCESQEFNQEILRQIYETLHLVAGGFYDSADNLHFLRVLYLHFISQKLEDLSVSEVLSSKKSLVHAVESLFQLFKFDFYPEKYAKIFEEIFDLDNVLDIIQLQELVATLEQKQAKQDAVALVNKVIAQQTALLMIVQSASKSKEFWTLAMQKLTEEFTAMPECDKKGTVYVIRSQQFSLQSTQCSAVEYVLSQQGPLNSQLYVYLKLALGLISRNVLIDQPGKVYDILYLSENHLEMQHQAQTYVMSNNNQSFKASIRHPPTAVASNQAVCDDCLKQKFTPFTLNSAVTPELTTQLFSVVMRRIKRLSKAIAGQEQVQLSKISQLKSMQTNSYGQLRDFLTRQRSDNNLGFAIVEKYNHMMVRFIVYCSQNASLASSIVQTLTNKTLIQSKTNEDLPAFSKVKVEVVNYKDIDNSEFKLLLLRNILLQIDPYNDQAPLLFKMTDETIKAIKSNYMQHKETAAAFQAVMLKHNPKYKPSAQTRSTRDRSSSNPQLNEFESVLIKQRSFFKKMADLSVSIVGLYVTKADEGAKLIERKSFIDTVLSSIQSFVLAEHNCISELIAETLNAFLMKSKEDTNPMKLKVNEFVSLQVQNNQNYQNTHSLIYERILEFILQTKLDFIKLAFQDKDASVNLQTKCLQSIKHLFMTLNSAVVIKEGETVREWLTLEMVKLARSIRPEGISMLKKLFIFIKEQRDSVTVDMQFTVKQFSQLITRIFAVIPKASQMKDFFSIFQEMLYYNQEMDEVDLSLLQEVLSILNSCLVLKHRIHHSLTHRPKNEMVDFFIFGHNAPGVILLSNFECSHQIQICLLFKISYETTKMLDKRFVSMVVLSMADQQELIGLDIEIVLDLQQQTFVLKDEQTGRKEPYVPFQPIKIENKWHLLTVRGTRSKETYFSAENLLTIEASIDTAESNKRVVYGAVRSDPKEKFYFALGNSVDYCLNPSKEKSKLFHGRCSLPVFCTGLPDLKQSEPALLWAVKEQIMEQINTKKITSLKGLDLNQQMQKWHDDRGSQIFKPNKKYMFPEFSTVETYTQAVIIGHQVLNKLGFMCAVHSRKASEVFVGIGGFKNLYPLVDKIVQSNLLELSRSKCGHVIGYIFKLLAAFINQEPSHMEMLMTNRNLIPMLRYCLLKVGKYSMITQDVLAEVKNIVRLSIVSQVSFHQDKKLTFSHISDTETWNKRHFYYEFLKLFTHSILLDISFLSQPCYIVPNHVRGDTSSNSSISAGVRQTHVLNEVMELIYLICCPKPLSSQRTKGNRKTDLESEPSLYETSTQQLVGPTGTYYTEYEKLRDYIVNRETISKLLAILCDSNMCQTSNIKLLSQVSESIASCILWLDQKDYFAEIINRTQSKLKDTHTDSQRLLQMLNLLSVVHKVIQNPKFAGQKGLMSVYQHKDMQLWFQEVNYSLNPSDDVSEESLQDQIVAICLQIQFLAYTYKKTWFGEKPLIEKVASMDLEKSQLQKFVMLNLNRPKVGRETYLTMMLATFGKQMQNSPSVDSVVDRIKNALVYDEQTPLSHTKVTDFDIDLFFVILQLMDKFTSETKFLLLSHFMLFQREHYESFMKLISGQVSGSFNPFDQKYKQFLFQLVTMHQSNLDPRLVSLAEQMLVDVCANQFIKSIDQKEELSSHDEWGLCIFRRIFIFIEQPTIQLNILHRIIKLIVLDLNSSQRQKGLSTFEQVKLNLKLIHLLQFIEEIYIVKRNELPSSFQHTFMLLMFLFEQIGLLTFDIPDRISADMLELFTSSRTSDYSNRQAKTVISQSSALQKSKAQMTIQTDSSYRQSKADSAKFSEDARDKQNIQFITEFSQLKHAPQKAQNEGQNCKATSNFISGGPVRIFLHIALNQLVFNYKRKEDFSNYVEILRYLIFRQRGSFFTTTIKQVFADYFNTEQVQTYNMFTRPRYIEVLARGTQNSEHTESPYSLKESIVSRQDSISQKSMIESEQYPKQILDLVRCELKIFKLTVHAIEKSTDKKLREEQQADLRKQSNKLGSYNDQQIAKTSYELLRRETKIGFTAVPGFLAIQLVSETVEIINQILEGHCEEENVSFAMQEVQSLQELESPDIKSFFPIRTMKSTLQNENQGTNIYSLLTFLFDCLKQEFNLDASFDQQNFDHIKMYQIVDRVIISLVSTCNKDPNEILKNVRFLSSFLEQEAFEDVILLESPEKLHFSTESKPKYQDLIKGVQTLTSVPETEEDDGPHMPGIQINLDYFTSDLKLQKSESSNIDSKSSQEQLDLTKNPIQKFHSLRKLQTVQDKQVNDFVLPNLNEESEDQSVLIESLKSEQFFEDRQSWVSSIKSENSTPQKQQFSNLSVVTDDTLPIQFRVQIVEYLIKLSMALQTFVAAKDENEKQRLAQKIILQMLNKEKQRRLYISFAQATSNCFATELHQVRVNAAQIYHNIEQEINLMTQEPSMKSAQQQNFLMQSQIITSSKARITSADRLTVSVDSHPLTAKAGKSFPFFNQQKQTSENPFIQAADYKNTLDYQFAKITYKKTVKRLQEDESSLWYDHCEELQLEFKSIKDIYDAIQPKLEGTVETAERRQIQNLTEFDVKGQPLDVLREVNLMIDHFTVVNNPKPRCCFQAQRRNADMWGRMMLLKPNRKALKYETWLYYDYFVFDFINQIYALSLQNDEDYLDLVKPAPSPLDLSRASSLRKEETKEELITINETRRIISNPDFRTQLSQIAEEQKQLESNSDSEELVGEPRAYSVLLQQLRAKQLQRMDRNKLLCKVLSGQPLKKVFQDDEVLAQKQRDKITAILKNHASQKVLNFEAQNVRVKGPLWGTIIISASYFVFISACAATPNRPDLKYTDQEENGLNSLDKKQLMIHWEQVDEVMKRKQLGIFQSVDIQTSDKKTYTFNLCSEPKCDEFIQAARAFILDKKDDCKVIENPKNHFNTNEMQFLQEWRNGQRSNLEFILTVNKYSGRSFNDLSQYPIFPWVLTDYSSSGNQFRENLASESCYRDFTKHPGNITEKQRNDLISQYESDLTEGELEGMMEMQYGKEPFQLQYGFSNRMMVTQWLCRMEPFTQMNYYYSDQGRDARLYIDFQRSYDSILSNKQFNSELLPEHFYFPEMLMNVNKFSLGNQKDANTGKLMQQDSVFLPRWAINYHDFVRQMREALESKYTTRYLSHWIDLVFGVHQQDITKQNLFFASAYEEWHEKAKNRNNITLQQVKSLIEFYQAPSKLFTQSLASTEAIQRTEKGQSLEENKTIFTQLIKAFLEFSKNKKRLCLGQIAVHNYLDQSTNIVHMIFNNEKKCLVFVRQEDQDKRDDTGNLIVYLCQETLSKDSFKEKSFDLQLRYEWVAESLNNVFQVFSQPSVNKLYVCGYLDNSVKIFDLEAKPGQHWIATIQDHRARVTCLRLSADFKYLISGDSDGVILHYGQDKKATVKEAFPYKLLFKLQDQMDEILAIDANQTLDMYVTLSRDGTIALRCQRKSTLWCHFKIYSKRSNKNGQETVVSGFTAAFRQIDALCLSLHGYIVLVGQSDSSKNQAKYLVYNLSGETLLMQYTERCTIKNVFLNSSEDQLIIAQNYMSKDNQCHQGNIRVLKLYQLPKIANLSQLCYTDVLSGQQKTSFKDSKGKDGAQKIPVLQAIAMKKGEASLNIFFEQMDVKPTTKEIICFETSKLPVWTQLEDMALAPRNRPE